MTLQPGFALAAPNQRPLPYKRLGIVSAIAAAAIWPGELGVVTRGLLIEAYLGVAVFVAATLALVYFAERALKFDTEKWLTRNKRLQIPAAAVLGMLPGCAGAVMVAAAYSGGSVTLGAMVAALTATMGDAAFLLIATKPEAAAVLLPVAAMAGILTGFATDRLAPGTALDARAPACGANNQIARIRPRDLAFAGLAIPGLGLGISNAFLIDAPVWVTEAAQPITLIAIALSLMIWLFSPVHGVTSPTAPPLSRTSEETSFIALWVIVAFLAYGYFETFTGFEPAQLFTSIAPLVPLMAILIGFIPGCGPQILVATLYINGALPFAALIGNAVSNDGDALFPAIALAPKAAIMATIYSAVPALVVAYGFFILAPGFLN